MEWWIILLIVLGGSILLLFILAMFSALRMSGKCDREYEYKQLKEKDKDVQ